MKSSKGLCSSKVMIALLVLLFTIIVVHIGLNTYNREMFGSLNNQNQDGNLLFYTNLLNKTLQKKVDLINKKNKSSADNSLLSNKILKNIYETRRPEIIPPPDNKSDLNNLCYINTDKY